MSSKFSPLAVDPRTYEFPATVVRIVDGDTFVARIRLAFGVLVDEHIRLRNINAPEMSTEEGLRSKKRLYELLPPDAEVVLKSHKIERSFVRYVFDVWRVENDGTLRDIAQCLVDEGFAEVSIHP